MDVEDIIMGIERSTKATRKALDAALPETITLTKDQYIHFILTAMTLDIIREDAPGLYDFEVREAVKEAFGIKSKSDLKEKEKENAVEQAIQEEGATV